ncbi:heme o synthase [Gallaecimonas pentaromativorans]|uniref:Protoheme IX farnesyltransferase n=1 Tax=Gallaecimonas pentaromativorans TaxID=584787 RepID=A0A3N1NQI1_9GAMM|nr:heme o synthase [Gallaecimonas pentaromativorans]ROQ22024.1 protoheme IX farnesyltransferase [Gallaecimonas pentaromativorans]
MKSLSLLAAGHWPWRDFLAITKPRVVMLLLLTALVGMILAQDSWPNPWLVINGLMGIGQVSAGAAAINHILDQHIDHKMARTRMRPLVQGRLSQGQAWVFAVAVIALGLMQLALWVNGLTALLTFAAMVGYAVIYTVFLKRMTPQNIVIGGLAGAMPPLLGWTAVTNSMDANAWLLVLIIFAWTPPHFWALAIARCNDYQRAGIPMLPVTHGIEYTKTCVLLYTLLLQALLLLPYLTGMSGLLYLAAALVLGGWFIWHAARLKWWDGPGQAMRTFRVSIWQLMLLFVVLLVDHGVA